MRIEDIQRRGEKPITGSPRALIVVPSMVGAQTLEWSLKAIARNLKLGATVVNENDSAFTISQKLSDGFDLFIAPPNTLSLMSFAHTSDVVVNEFDRIVDSKLLEIAPTAVPCAKVVLSTTIADQGTLFLSQYFQSEGQVPPQLEAKQPSRLTQNNPKHTFIEANNDSLSQLFNVLNIRKRKINAEKCLIFCDSTQQVTEIKAFLEKNYFISKNFYSTLSEKLQDQLIMGITKGSIKTLILTEISARQKVLPDVQFVVNYGLPSSAKAYEYRASHAKEGCITISSSENMRKWQKLAGLTEEKKQAKTVKLDK
jgi:superfamily II DNA/RNA helicase